MHTTFNHLKCIKITSRSEHKQTHIQLFHQCHKIIYALSFIGIYILFFFNKAWIYSTTEAFNSMKIWGLSHWGKCNPIRRDKSLCWVNLSLTFLCSSKAWSAVSFSFLNCSSNAFNRCFISCLRSTPCFSSNSIWAKFQSTVSPLLGVSAGDFSKKLKKH